MKKLVFPLFLIGLITVFSCHKNNVEDTQPIIDPVHYSIVGDWKIDSTVILVDSTKDPIDKNTVLVDDSSAAHISDTGTVQLGIFLFGNDLFNGSVWNYEQVNDSLLRATDTTQSPEMTLDITIKTLSNDSAVIVPDLKTILGAGHSAIVTLRRD